MIPLAKFERKCVVCGKTYVFCPIKNLEDPRWHLIYCGDNCKDIWNLITTTYDQEGAKAAAEGLKEKDLSNFGDIRKDAQEKIIRIFDEAGEELPFNLSEAEDAENVEDVEEIEDDDVVTEDFSDFDYDDPDSVSPSVDE